MNEVELSFAILALALVGTDIAVRLAIAPHRRDEQLGELMSSLSEPYPVTGSEVVEADPLAGRKPARKLSRHGFLIRASGGF